MEHHGSWSKSTRAYWDARAIAAHTRQTANTEFPCQLFLDGSSRHWLSHSGVSTLAALCSFTAGHVMVLSKYGTAMRRRHWQLAQAMAPKYMQTRAQAWLVPGTSHPDRAGLDQLESTLPQKKLNNDNRYHPEYYLRLQR
jgi:hypothetical protein